VRLPSVGGYLRFQASCTKEPDTTSTNQFDLEQARVYPDVNLIAQRLGLRLPDNSAFVQQITGINMTTSDKGVEFGWERGSWDAQLAVSYGTARGPVASHGKQLSSQLIYVQPMWRPGAAANYNDPSRQQPAGVERSP
jgi:hypothetical protein